MTEVAFPLNVRVASLKQRLEHPVYYFTYPQWCIGAPSHRFTEVVHKNLRQEIFAPESTHGQVRRHTAGAMLCGVFGSFSVLNIRLMEGWQFDK
jgi:hypothetical protein